MQRLKDDPDLKKAIETLNNQSEYSKILSVMKINRMRGGCTNLPLIIVS